MKAIVLAAGMGTRIRSRIGPVPKVMAPIHGHPLLEITLELLRTHGVSEVHINLYYLPEVVTRYFGDGSQFGVRIVYHLEDRLWGTAGSVARMASECDGAFFVLYGDVLTDLDLASMLVAHRAQSAEATVALYRVSNPSECGIVELDDKNSIIGFHEKPSLDEVRSNLANAGVYVLNPSVLDLVPPQTFCDFGLHFFPRLLAEEKQILGYPVPKGTFLLDIGTPANYDEAQVTWQAAN